MKKYTKYFILSFFVVLGIVLIIMGSSYSLFNYQVKGKTKNKITTGVSTEYKERILNGTDPILKDNLIPVQISDNGTVTRADTAKKWYSYENKEWANAVVLKQSYDENTIYDLSGNGYDAKLVNGLSLIKESNGNVALHFDGIDDYAELPVLPASINWQDGIIVEFEATWEDFNSFSRIFDFGNAQADTISIYNYYTSSGLTFNYLDSATSGQRRITKDELIIKNQVAKYKINVAKTSDGYITNIYKNSELVLKNISTVGYMKNIERTTNFLGKSNYKNDQLFKGDIYNLKITQTDGTVVLWYDFSIAEKEVIEEGQIESYFVWIPRYKYKIFDEGNYTGLTSISSKEQLIDIVFENKDITPSNGTTVGDYLTHPAFTSFDSNGFWVGKFETGYDGATTTAEAEMNSVATDKIIIKPNVYSWRSITIGNMFKNSYDYQRSLDSHMMKNTEWGAVAYLQHSEYGSATSVRINNNRAYITGYSATVEPTLGYNGGNSFEGNRNESTSIGIDGTYTVNYLNSNSTVSSTTGNYTGIYDMSGGAWEDVMCYTTGASTVGGSSGITDLYANFFSDTNYTKYWDKYTSTSNTNYNNRILGDATGEIGPFGSEVDPDNVGRYKASWYRVYADFMNVSSPWLDRGGGWHQGTGSGNFAFSDSTGGVYTHDGYRIVLTPQ